MLGLGVLVGLPALALVATGDAPALASLALLVGITALLAFSERVAHESAPIGSPVHDIELLATPAIGADRIETSPGNLLVPVRKPGLLAHLATALQAAGDRDVVVMTVRLVGVDASEELALTTEATDDERRVLERCGDARRTIGASRPPGHRAGHQRFRRRRGYRRAAALGRSLCRRIRDAERRRPGATARRGVGAPPQAEAVRRPPRRPPQQRPDGRLPSGRSRSVAQSRRPSSHPRTLARRQSNR